MKQAILVPAGQVLGPIDEEKMMNQEVKHPEIEVELVGGDSNAFAILGKVSRALKSAGIDSSEFMAEATAGDYDHLLRTAMRWVSVS